MRSAFRSLTVSLIVPALLLAMIPSTVQAGDRGARLEGLLLDVQGRPASGYGVLLIDDQGREVQRSPIDPQGLYSFRGMTSGAYSLGIETPEGQKAPVATPPIRVDDGQLARRDLQISETDPRATGQVVQGNYGLGMWWAGLSTAGRAWTIVALTTFFVVTVAIIADDDEETQETDF